MLEKFKNFEIEKRKSNQVKGGSTSTHTIRDGRRFGANNTGVNIQSSAS